VKTDEFQTGPKLVGTTRVSNARVFRYGPVHLAVTIVASSGNVRGGVSSTLRRLIRSEKTI